MKPRTLDDFLDAFIADGNTLIGPRPVTYNGTFHMLWKGGGSVLEFGENVTLSMARIQFVSGAGTIRLGHNVTAKGRLEVTQGGLVQIEEGTVMNRTCDIRGGEGAEVQIGKNCLFSNVKIMTSDMHSILDLATSKRTNPAAGIVIEDEVWIAEDVKIAKGVRVGTGAVIAAGSLVTRSIAPMCLAAGRPARVVRTGVSWSRTLKRVAPLPAPAFQAADIPLDKEVLRLLVSRQEYGLVDAVISAHMDAPLALFAKWYLVLCREKLGKPLPNAVALLDEILAEAPGHEAARKMRARLTG